MNDRISDAITIYRELLARWPDDRKVLKELSGVLWYCWYFDDAASVAQQGIALYPDERVLVNHYVLSLTMLGRSSEALEVSKTYVEYSESYLIFHFPPSFQLFSLDSSPSSFGYRYS